MLASNLLLQTVASGQRQSHILTAMTSPARHFAPIDFKSRFPALDGIRALAIVMVFALHYGGGTHGGALLNLVNQVRLRGWIGVDLFFTLSGFLITGILFDTRSDSHYFKRFFARRSVRIFPIFYLVFSIFLLLTPIFRYQWQPGHTLFLLYLGNFSLAANSSLEVIRSANHPAASAHLVHFWSLCVEEQFYLIWPLAVWLIKDRIRLIRFATALSVLALVLRIVMVKVVRPENIDGWMVHQLPFRMDSLLLGAILALLLRGKAADQWQRRCKWIFLISTGVFIALSIAAPNLYAPWLMTSGFSLLALASAGLIGVTLRPGSPAFRLFNVRPLRVLGKYSYGFYVYHVLWATAWSALVGFLTTRFHSSILANATSDILNFVLTFLVAKLSYDLFEVRFLRFKKYFEYDSELREHRTNFAEELKV
jgi:peptidoglycan/LPS O-acetylase OafA/YrhL